MARGGCWADGELLGFDLETTGVDRYSDRPVSYALVTMLGGEVVQRDAGLINPGCPVPAGASAVHGITTAQAEEQGAQLPWGIAWIAASLAAASARGVPVVGMNLDFDLTILDVQCRRIGGKGLLDLGWSGPALDALVIDRRCDRYRKGRRTLSHLCAHYDIEQEMAHDAAADAEAALRAVRAMCDRFPELHATQLSDLHRAQVDWHRQWVVSFDEYLGRRELARLDPREYEWPIAAAIRTAA